MTDWDKYVKAGQFLEPAALGEATSQIESIARRENVKTALAGGFALQHYGSPRLTGDVDVVAECEIEGLPRGKPLSFGGERTKAPNDVPVDVIVRDDDYADLYEDALNSAVKISALPMKIVRPEHLVAMKMVAGRGKDQSDLEFLVLSGLLDLVETRRVIREFLGRYAVREFDQFVEETKWKASRGRV